MSKQKQKNNLCTQPVKNLSSYCGLVDAKTRASDKDLPVNIPEPLLHEIT